MEIAKAVAASVRSMGLNTKKTAAGGNPAAPTPAPHPASPAELRVHRANLELLESARATLTRTIALLK